MILPSSSSFQSFVLAMEPQMQEKLDALLKKDEEAEKRDEEELITQVIRVNSFSVALFFINSLCFSLSDFSFLTRVCSM